MPIQILVLDDEKIVGERLKASLEKEGYIQDMMALYDNSAKYFPKRYTPSVVAIDKSLLMYENKMGSDAEIYEMLDVAFKKDTSSSYTYEYPSVT